MNIDNLTISVSAAADRAARSLDSLCNKLNVLGSVVQSVNSGGLSVMASALNTFATAVQQANSISMRNFTNIAEKINKLSSVNANNIISASLSIQDLTETLSGLSNVNTNIAPITEIANAVGTLGSAKVTKAVNNLPLVVQYINNLVKSMASLPTVTQETLQLVNALSNLAAQGSKIGSAAKSMDNALTRTNITLKQTKLSFKGLASYLGKFYATFFLAIRGIKGLWNSIESAFDYVETYNYFNVAVNNIGKTLSEQTYQAGEESAEAYVNGFATRLKALDTKLTGYMIGEKGEATVTNSVGLGQDIEQMMAFQAKVGAVTTSVGLLSEASETATKTLSMLAVDLSSLTNMDLSSVMTNLSSGLIGQSRALYKYGVDITNATLQEYAYAQGITKSVSAMTQAEKMQLRLLAILDQTKIAWTDAAETINSVANQYRIFQAQITNLGRTIGNLFLPIVQNVLPYVNGLVIALNRLFQELGMSLWGSSWLTDLNDSVNGSVIADDVDDLTDSLENADSQAKKLKADLMGFDEINKLSSDSTSSATSSDDYAFDLTSAINEAYSDYEQKWNKAYENMSNKASEIAQAIYDGLKGQSFTSIANLIVSKMNTAVNSIDWTMTGKKVAAKLNSFFSKFDFEKLGGTISDMVTGLLGFLNTAIVETDWTQVGTAIGKAISSIDWGKVVFNFISLVGNVVTALGSAFTSSLFTNPMGTILVSAFVAVKYTKVGTTLANNLITAFTKQWRVMGGFSTSLSSAWHQNKMLTAMSTIGATLSAAIVGWGIGTAIYNQLIEPLQDKKLKKIISSFATDYSKTFSSIETALANMNARLKTFNEELDKNQADRKQLFDTSGADIGTLETIAKKYIEMAKAYDKFGTSENSLKAYWEWIENNYPDLAKILEENRTDYAKMTTAVNEYVESLKTQAQVQAAMQNMTGVASDLQKAQFELSKFSEEDVAQIKQEEKSFEALRQKLLQVREAYDKAKQEVADYNESFNYDSEKAYKAQQKLEKLEKAFNDVFAEYQKQLYTKSATSQEYYKLIDEIAELNSEMEYYANIVGSFTNVDTSKYTQSIGNGAEAIASSYKKYAQEAAESITEYAEGIKKASESSEVQSTLKEASTNIAKPLTSSITTYKGKVAGENYASGVSTGATDSNSQKEIKGVATSWNGIINSVFGSSSLGFQIAKSTLANAKEDPALGKIAKIGSAWYNELKNFFFGDGMILGQKVATAFKEDAQSTTALGRVEGAGSSWISKLSTFFVNTTLGRVLAQGVATSSMDSVSQKKFKDFPKTTVEWLEKYYSKESTTIFQNSADYIIEGLTSALKNSAKSNYKLDETGNLLAKFVNAGFTNAQDINSPSKVWYGYGNYIVEGLADGVEDNTKKAVKAAQDLATDMNGVMVNTSLPTSDFSANISTSLSGTSVGIDVTAQVQEASYQGMAKALTDYGITLNFTPNKLGVFQVVQEEATRYTNQTGLVPFNI